MDAQSADSRKIAQFDGSRYAAHLPVAIGRVLGIPDRQTVGNYFERHIGAVHTWIQTGGGRSSSGQTEPNEEMMRDKLTRREDRALLKALREVVLTQYPNPERKDCPGTSVLRAIATRRSSMFDPAHEHVGNCSPCFKELTVIQQTLRRRNAALWAVATAGTAI